MDYGYSNWTVEGTNIDCLKKLNPYFPVDAWYGGAPEGDFGKDCQSFFEGDGVEIDVDMESGMMEDYSSDPEIKELLKNYE